MEPEFNMYYLSQLKAVMGMIGTIAAYLLYGIITNNETNF